MSFRKPLIISAAVAAVVGGAAFGLPAATAAPAPSGDVVVVATCHGYTVFNPLTEPVIFMAGVSSAVPPEVSPEIAPGATYFGTTATNPLHWEANLSSGQLPAGFGDIDTVKPCTPTPDPTPTVTPTPTPTPTPEPTATPTPDPTPEPTATPTPTPTSTPTATPAPKPTSPPAVTPKPAAPTAPAVVKPVPVVKPAPAAPAKDSAKTPVTKPVPGAVVTD